jgi:dinuclear metal center YbgI/SA1388 family protein
MKRVELEKYLNELYHYEEYDDYCFNGLQIEGADDIKKIVFAVSFNSLLLEKAVSLNADAVIVHHGIFGKDFFKIHDPFKNTVKEILNRNISLFGIHLPMDAQPEIGNNAELVRMISASVIEKMNVGFLVENTRKLSLQQILHLFGKELGMQHDIKQTEFDSPLHYKKLGEIQYYDFGPDTPYIIGILSGGGSSYIQDALKAGADTFITGDLKEHIPAMLYDNKMNYINLGHYRSEKTGILALKKHIETKYPVDCIFIDVENPL